MSYYKAIVLDLDGTLLKQDETISSRNKDFLVEQSKQGVKILLATGRPLNMTLKYHQELQLDTPLICLNGAVIYDPIEEKVVKQSIFTSDDIETIKDTVNENAKVLIAHTWKANYQLINTIGPYLTEHWQIEKEGVIPPKDEPYLKLSVHFDNVNNAAVAFEKLVPSFEIANWGDSFEITTKSVTKWYGLKKVLNALQILPQEVVAFGDGANDIEMIKNAGIGVAMENARYMVKKVASHITSHHEKDGVSEFFTTFQTKATINI